MSVDMKRLQAGDITELRCGARLTIASHEPSTGIFLFEGEKVSNSSFGGPAYRRDGAFNGAVNHPFDIVAIHPAKKPAPAVVDLSEAKAGDRVTVVLDEKDAKNLRKGDHLRERCYWTPDQIIALEPAPEPEFDWKTVLWGMFFDYEGRDAYFVGRASNDSYVHVSLEGYACPQLVGKDRLKRSERQPSIKLPEAA